MVAHGRTSVSFLCWSEIMLVVNLYKLHMKFKFNTSSIIQIEAGVYVPSYRSFSSSSHQCINKNTQINQSNTSAHVLVNQLISVSCHVYLVIKTLAYVRGLTYTKSPATFPSVHTNSPSDCLSVSPIHQISEVKDTVGR